MRPSLLPLLLLLAARAAAVFDPITISVGSSAVTLTAAQLTAIAAVR